MYLKETILASTIVFCFGVVMFMEFLYPTIRENSVVVKEVFIEQESPDFTKEVEEIKTKINKRNNLKKQSVTKNCSDLSLFEKIVLVISKVL